MIVAGVDEAGRGPLAGAVIAAAVVLPEGCEIAGLTDSKKLTPAKRAALEVEVKACALAWALGESSVTEIDGINILQASLLAMRRAVEKLSMLPDLALIDGNRVPELACEARAIIKGDMSEACISAASILAKEARDRQMLVLHREHPQYGFDQHKGYGTRQHLEAIAAHGVTSWHRRSFRPVREALEAVA